MASYELYLVVIRSAPLATPLLHFASHLPRPALLSSRVIRGLADPPSEAHVHDRGQPRGLTPASCQFHPCVFCPSSSHGHNATCVTRGAATHHVALTTPTANPATALRRGDRCARKSAITRLPRSFLRLSPATAASELLQQGTPQLCHGSFLFSGSEGGGGGY